MRTCRKPSPLIRLSLIWSRSWTSWAVWRTARRLRRSFQREELLQRSLQYQLLRTKELGSLLLSLQHRQTELQQPLPPASLLPVEAPLSLESLLLPPSPEQPLRLSSSETALLTSNLDMLRRRSTSD